MCRYQKIALQILDGGKYKELLCMGDAIIDEVYNTAADNLVFQECQNYNVKQKIQNYREVLKKFGIELSDSDEDFYNNVILQIKMFQLCQT
jgi:hypothetical protein